MFILKKINIWTDRYNRWTDRWTTDGLTGGQQMDKTHKQMLGRQREAGKYANDSQINRQTDRR